MEIWKTIILLDFGGFSWEERNQAKGYAQSEVRLVEIQEKLCDDVERGQDQCHDNHHAWEAHLEEWWQEHQDEKSLKDYLCVETLKVTRHSTFPVTPLLRNVAQVY